MAGVRVAAVGEPTATVAVAAGFGVLVAVAAEVAVADGVAVALGVGVRVAVGDGVLVACPGTGSGGAACASPGAAESTRLNPATIHLRVSIQRSEPPVRDRRKLRLPGAAFLNRSGAVAAQSMIVASAVGLNNSRLPTATCARAVTPARCFPPDAAR